ncbi:MAG: binding-protein-dependent transport system inner rane component [Anaerocolumna sp.]|jgi:raffinose/stachyose/melibiose transport system permease protein|nr:binding-protein-dependent transport system inner rane component [Anaerocolumna sp.]
MAVNNRQNRLSLGGLVIRIILILWAITTIYPFLWVINNSFKPSKEVINTSFALPKDFTLENYSNAFEKQNILKAYKNSLIISGTVMVVCMLLGAMMAFGMTRYRFRGKAVIHSLLLASLMFPVYSTIIPVFRNMAGVGLLNQPISVILPQAAGNLSFAAVILMGFLKGLPTTFEEAAYLEGAGVARIFTTIILPFLRPSMATVAVFSFLWSYNDLLTQLIMIRKHSSLPVSALLIDISSKYGTDYGLMASCVTLIVIPVLIIYFILQKYIIKGLTAGAVKG